MSKLKLLLPLRLRYQGKSNSPATSESGIRYGAHRWLTVSLGHVHFVILPHWRVWTSIYWRDA